MAIIRRLRQRLYIVEPVYRATVAHYRIDGPKYGNERDRIDRIEAAVDRALATERCIGRGEAISDSDLMLKVP